MGPVTQQAPVGRSAQRLGDRHTPERIERLCPGGDDQGDRASASKRRGDDRAVVRFELRWRIESKRFEDTASGNDGWAHREIDAQ